MFKIIIPFYNSKWITKSIESVKNQNFKDFNCLIIDDNSDIDMSDDIHNIIKNDTRFKYIKNEERKYSLYNLYHGTNYLYENNDDDIIVILDGDDWLYNEYVLNIVNDVYEKNDCLLTYGSWISFPDNKIGLMCREYPKNIVKNGDYRYHEWLASHLRTYKYKIWNKINAKDLIDERTGKFYHMTGDLATMFPLLEMSGKKNIFIKDILYVYNISNPINDHKVNNKEQIRIENIIRSKKKYKAIYE